MNMIASTGQLRAGYIRWALVLVPGIILLGMLAGQLGGSATGNPWFASLVKPAVYPPAAVFPLAWTILYGLMGFALAVVITAVGAPGRKPAIIAFLVQLALNLAWSPLFFGQHQITAALFLIVILDVMVILTIVLFWRVRKLAAILLLPYIAWLLFASYLNWAFLQANPGMDGVEVSGAIQRYEF